MPEGWDREGTGRRFILFPHRSLPPETATKAAITLAGDATRSLVLTPSRNVAQSVIEHLGALSPSPAIFLATDVENSLEPFLNKDYSALVLHNRYDGIDLPGDACHLELVFGLPGATNAQETFFLNRLQVHSLLRDRIRTRLTQALGRCTRNPTDHAVVIMSGPRTLDFCIKSENRQGFHPEIQAEIQYGLDASQVKWPKEFIDTARALLKKESGWEQVDQWIRDERDSYPQLEDEVAQTLMTNVVDEIDYAEAMWVGDYQRALEKARSCADRLSGPALAHYRAWWYYLAGSAAALSIERDNATHLREAVRELFDRACAASPRATWFREITRLVGFDDTEQEDENLLLIVASEAVERRLQQVGIAGAGFETESQAMIDLLDGADAKTFEHKGWNDWDCGLGLAPFVQVVPVCQTVYGHLAKKQFWRLRRRADEQPRGPVSLSTAREAQGHIKWVESNMHFSGSAQVSTVVISDRTSVAAEALPNTEALFVVNLTYIRQLGRRIASTARSLRTQASSTSNEDFRRVIAERLKAEALDPRSIQAALQCNPLNEFPVNN